MELAGLVSRTRDGRIVDRFRNRLILPIVHNSEILGFVARRHPDHGDNHPYAGPKYLNTPDTLLYSKGAQLYGPATDAAPGAVPVLVEGPLDAIAITLAGTDRYVGYAPLGTSLTSEQASQIRPVRAYPADCGHRPRHPRPGRRRTRLLACSPSTASIPRHATWAPGSDPADTLHSHGAAGVQAALHAAQPLAATLIDERLRNLPADQAATAAIDVLAARPGPTWTDSLTSIAAAHRRRPAASAGSTSQPRPRLARRPAPDRRPAPRPTAAHQGPAHLRGKRRPRHPLVRPRQPHRPPPHPPVRLAGPCRT